MKQQFNGLYSDPSPRFRMSSGDNRNGCTTAAIIPAYNEAERVANTVQSVDR